MQGSGKRIQRPDGDHADDAYIPIIHLGLDLLGAFAPREQVASAIARACETSGFLTVVGHGVPADVIDTMYETARSFFRQPEQTKAEVETACAWRTALEHTDRPTALALSRTRNATHRHLAISACHDVARGTPSQVPLRPVGVGKLDTEFAESIAEQV
jgi:isopenicillin N synthase-like dioxygenase